MTVYKDQDEEVMVIVSFAWRGWVVMGVRERV